jgi:two-component system phosphate regulon sensor histidine kinase PhoR
VPSALRRWASSYRVRIVGGYLLVVALVAGAWAWSLYGPLTAVVMDQQRSHLTSIAQAGALVLAETPVNGQDLAERLVAKTNLRVTIVAADGRVLADSQTATATMENHLTRPEIVAALAGKTGYAQRVSATQAIEEMYVAVPATLDGHRVALRVSEPLDRINGLASTARGSGLLLLLIAIVGALVLTWRLSSTAARPVIALKGAAEAMAAGDLSVQVPRGEGDLAGLSEALTGLGDRIREHIGELVGEQTTLRTALDGLQAAVFLFDGDRVTLANSAAGTMFRTPARGWPGAGVADIAMPASLSAAVAERLGCEEPGSVEIGPDPERRYFRVTAVPLSATDSGSRTLVVVEDVTERSRLDSVRRDFVANASHELKTPTASIQLLAESASTASDDGDTAQAMVFVGQMKDEADRLRRLVADLLDLERLESAPAPGTVTDLRAAIDLALTGHRRAAAGKGLAVSADLAAVEGIDIYAAADPTDVAIALDNLLDNAIAYTEAGSVTVRLTADHRTTVLTVSDTGIGIPPEHLPRVFERFYRVDAARTRASGGTGLGLSLVRHVVERAGGTIGIASKVGAGTTVTVTLPRAR